jgi:hypothetical protein
MLTRAQWVQRDLPVITPKVASNRVIRWVRTAIILAFWGAATQTIWIALSYSFRMQATAAVLEESLIKMHGACLMLPDAPAHKYDIMVRRP